MNVSVAIPDRKRSTLTKFTVAVALCALLLDFLPTTAAGGSGLPAEGGANNATTTAANEATVSTTTAAASAAAAAAAATSAKAAVVTPARCSNRPWDQCGGFFQGKEFTGETCCPPGAGCSRKSEWWSQCVPGYVAPAAVADVDGEMSSSSRPVGTAGTTLTAAAAIPVPNNLIPRVAVPLTKTCANLEWSQCGGREYNGLTCCPVGSGCAYNNEWYSQCVPGYATDDDGGNEGGGGAGGKCQPLWFQCGGELWNGPSKCCAGGECVKQDTWYSQCKPAKARGKVDRLCIFDFDDTIKVGAGRQIGVGRDAKPIIDKCREMGYGVAIASASCETGFQKVFLRDAVDEDIFSDDMLASEAYQGCQPNKTPALRKVLKHFEMEEVPECAVFFDDKDFNGKFSAEVDVPFVKVDPEYGVTWNDFWFGMSLLDKNCPVAD